jgi:hypothetical protein
MENGACPVRSLALFGYLCLRHLERSVPFFGYSLGHITAPLFYTPDQPDPINILLRSPFPLLLLHVFGMGKRLVLKEKVVLSTRL